MPGIEWTSSLDYTGFADGMKKIQQSIAETAATVDRAGGNIESMFHRIAGVAGLALSFDAAKGFVNQVVEMRSFFQDIESSMKVFLGSAEKGAEFTQKLKDYAYYNMFEFKDLAAASQQMIAYGNSIDTIIPRLDQLSNVAVGTHGSLMELVGAYNKAKSTGFVDSQSLASWATKGVVIKDVLKEMGVQANSTRVTFEQLNMVLDHITGEGGMFHNLQLSMMENISAEIGQFEDNYNAMLNEIGENWQDEIVQGIKVGEWLIENYKTVAVALGSLIGAYGSYKAALIATRTIENSYQGLKLKQESEEYTKAIEKEKEALNELKKSRGELTEEDLKAAVAKGEMTKYTAQKLEQQREELMQRVSNGELSAEGASQISEKQKELALLQQIREQEISNIDTQIAKNNEEIDNFKSGIEQKRQELADLEEVRRSYQDAYYEKDWKSDKQSYESPEFKTFQDANKEYEDASNALDEYTAKAEESIESLLGQNEALEEQKATIIANTASEEGNTVATGANTVQENTNTASKKGNTVATGAKTTATNVDTVATEKNTVMQKLHSIQLKASAKASQIWTVAVGQMRAAWQGLGTAIMTNPIGVALGAISLTLPWIMQWVSSSDEAKTKTEEYGAAADKATSKVNALHAVLKTASDGTKVQKDAMSQLIQQYNEYGIKLDETIMKGDSEKAKVDEVKKHHEELIAVIRQEAIERQKANDIAEAGKEKEDAQDKAKSRLEKGLSDEFSDAAKGQMANLVSEADIEKAIELTRQYNEEVERRKELSNKTGVEYNELAFYEEYIKKLEALTGKEVEFTKNLGLGEEAQKSASHQTALYIASLVKAEMANMDAAQAAQDAADAAETAADRSAEGARLQKMSVAELRDEMKRLVSTYKNTTLNIDIFFKQHNVPEWMKKFNAKDAKHNSAYFTQLAEEQNRKAEEARKRGDVEAAKQFEKQRDENQVKAIQYNQWSETKQKEEEKAEKRKELRDRTKNAKTRNDWKSIKQDSGQLLDDAVIGSSEEKELEKIQNQAQNQLDIISGKAGNKAAAAAKKAATEAARKAEEQRKAEERQAEDSRRYDQEQAKLQRDRQYAIEQEKIDLMDEGSAKERAQAEFDHQKRLDQIDDQEKELLQKEIDHQKKLYETETKNKKARGFYALGLDKNVKLTEEQRSGIVAEISSENAKWRQMQERWAKEDAASMRSYLKEYGNYEQQRLAITEEFEQKIKDAKSEGERLSLQAQMRKALADLDMSEFKDSVNWEDIFGNLETFTISQLQGFKEVLRRELADSSNDIDAYKSIVERIDQINDAILSAEDEERSFLGISISWGMQRRKLEMEVAEAKQRQADIDAKMAGSQLAMNVQRGQTRDALAALGIQRQNVSGADATEILSQLKSMGYNEETDTYQKVRSELEKLAKTEEDYNGILKTKKKVDGEVTTKQGQLNKFLGDFKERMKDLSSAFQLITDNLSSLPDLAANLGVDMESGLGKGISGMADTANAAMGAYSDFMSGNYIGAASKAVDALSSFGDTLGAFGIGGFGSSDADLHKDIERLTASNESLSTAIDALSEEMAEASILDVKDIYEQQKQYLDQSEKNTREMMQRSGAAYSNGFMGIGGKGSSNKKIDKGVSSSEWGRVSQIVGRTIDSASDFFSLSSREMYDVMMNANDVFSHIMDLANDGAEDAAAYMMQYVEYWKQAEDLENNYRDRITGTSFDNLRDNFLSTLTDMESDADDFAKAFEQTMFEALVNNFVMDEKFDQWLQEWYEAYSEALRQNDTARLKQLEDDYVKMRDDKIEERNRIAEAIGLDSMSPDQTATTSTAEKITYDQAEQITGILTAIQIAVEQGGDTRRLILENIQTMNGLVSGNNAMVSEIRNIILTSNEYLLDIKKSNRSIYDEFGVKMDSIIQKLEDLR